MAESMRPSERSGPAPAPASAARPDRAEARWVRESAPAWVVDVVLGTTGAAGTVVEIRERPFLAQVDVRVRTDEAAFGALEHAVGARPSATPNRSTGAASVARIVMAGACDEWLIVDPARTPTALESVVVAAIRAVGRNGG